MCVCVCVREREIEKVDSYLIGHVLDLHISSTRVHLGDVDASRGTGAHSSSSSIIAWFLRRRLSGGHLLGTGTSTLLTWSGSQMEPGYTMYILIITI